MGEDIMVATASKDDDDGSVTLSALGGRSANALLKRAEQLKRWDESETNKETSNSKPELKRKVKFPEGCVFLAACACSDIADVERLLNEGADINTSNVDGLTALHQAVIDENQAMVEFLIQSGADIDAQDNEGWTSLHAAVSCGFVDIARFLLESNADVGIPNNDGELPLDLADMGSDMVALLQEATKGVDLDAARHREEQRMLEDAMEWQRTRTPFASWRRHPKNGATPLHVAAAKGYIKVMNILLQAGHEVDAADNDGWTPLHAAAHWSDKPACEILCEHMANMESKNNAGQTCFDLADNETTKFLTELQHKQAELKKEKENEPALQNLDGNAVTKRKLSISRYGGSRKNIAKVDEVTEASILRSASESDASDTEMASAEPSSPSKAASASDSLQQPSRQPDGMENTEFNGVKATSLKSIPASPVVERKLSDRSVNVTAATKVPASPELEKPRKRAELPIVESSVTKVPKLNDASNVASSSVPSVSRTASSVTTAATIVTATATPHSSSLSMSATTTTPTCAAPVISSSPSKDSTPSDGPTPLEQMSSDSGSGKRFVDSRFREFQEVGVTPTRSSVIGSSTAAASSTSSSTAKPSTPVLSRPVARVTISDSKSLFKVPSTSVSQASGAAPSPPLTPPPILNLKFSSVSSTPGESPPSSSAALVPPATTSPSRQSPVPSWRVSGRISLLNSSVASGGATSVTSSSAITSTTSVVMTPAMSSATGGDNEMSKVRLRAPMGLSPEAPVDAQKRGVPPQQPPQIVKRPRPLSAPPGRLPQILLFESASIANLSVAAVGGLSRFTWQPKTSLNGVGGSSMPATPLAAVVESGGSGSDLSKPATPTGQRRDASISPERMETDETSTAGVSPGKLAAGPKSSTNAKLTTTKSLASGKVNAAATVAVASSESADQKLPGRDDAVAKTVVSSAPSISFDITTRPSRGRSRDRIYRPATPVAAPLEVSATIGTRQSSKRIAATATPTEKTTTESRKRSSYAAPKRDEESESERKAYARRQRESRRSTQGITAEDLRTLTSPSSSGEIDSVTIDLSSNVGDEVTKKSANQGPASPRSSSANRSKVLLPDASSGNASSSAEATIRVTSTTSSASETSTTPSRYSLRTSRFGAESKASEITTVSSSTRVQANSASVSTASTSRPASAPVVTPKETGISSTPLSTNSIANAAVNGTAASLESLTICDTTGVGESPIANAKARRRQRQTRRSTGPAPEDILEAKLADEEETAMGDRNGCLAHEKTSAADSTPASSNRVAATLDVKRLGGAVATTSAASVSSTLSTTTVSTAASRSGAVVSVASSTVMSTGASNASLATVGT